MPGHDLSLHQVQCDVVQECGHDFILVSGVDAHAARLIPQQRGVEKEEFPEGDFIAVMDAGHEARGCGKPRGGEGFVLTP
jgi:hypothetical protein